MISALTSPQGDSTICYSLRILDPAVWICLAIPLSCDWQPELRIRTSGEIRTMQMPGCQPRDSDLIGPESSLSSRVLRSFPDALKRKFSWKQVHDEPEEKLEMCEGLADYCKTKSEETVT